MPARKFLKSSDARLRLIEENVGTGTWAWDLDTSEVSWSPGLCRILGIDPHAVVPTIDLYQSLVHPDDQLDFDDAIGLVSDGRLEDRTFRIIRPDGVQRWLRSRAQPHMDRSGRTMMMTGVIEDITEEQAIRASLKTQKDTVRLLTRLLGGWVWRAYPNGKLIETAHWTRLTGQGPAEAHDWAKLAAIHPEDRQAFRDAWHAANAGRKEYHSLVRVRTVSGAYATLRSRALPLLDLEGNPVQWVGHSAEVETADAGPEPGLLEAAHIRASRALLDWTAPELAERSGVSFSTVRRMEQSTHNIRPESLARIRDTLEEAGILFSIADNGQVSVGLKLPPLSCGASAPSDEIMSLSVES